MRILGFWLCAVFLTASVAFAQFDTAAVVGTVCDGSGAVVPSAQVTLTPLWKPESPSFARPAQMAITSLPRSSPGAMSSPPRRPGSPWRSSITSTCRLAHDVGFGTITSAFDPRQLQFGFKVLW